ncbi:MAG TPA: hypothetical protein VNV15_04855 [Opitutaceae bacterium]|jgi:hypothetical protein|nr:hypothetical protein [Opitutaceae bacterium]
MTSLARQLRLGRLAYRLWHRPRQWCDLARTYGLGLSVRALLGERRMCAAATRLPVLPDSETKLTAPIYFLTGRRFWQQTLFCAHSFVRQSGLGAEFCFVSDGTMDDEIAQQLTRLFPAARVLGHAGLDEKIASVLPPARFPTLHAHRRRFVLLRKLTDTLAGERGYRLFLDSDMIFWRRPDEMLDRLARAEPFYMADLGDDGYTLPRSGLQEKLGVTAAPGVNSGVVAVHPEQVDWDLLERACALLLAEGGDQRLLEQTLWAIVFGAQNGRPLPASDYRLVIDPPTCREAIAAGRPALLHYAWHARLQYAAAEWQYYLETASVASA